MTLSTLADVPASAAQPTAGVWRPVQYLGSKLRALDSIVSVASGLSPAGVLWDAFTGSSVVAQAAGKAGFQVFATDSQQASATFATALLGVGATPAAIAAFPEVMTELLTAQHPDEGEWAEFRTLEDALLLAGDYEGLMSLYAVLPQRWRTSGQWNQNTPLTVTFAGTYLSLRQSMAIDAGRHRLGVLQADDRLDAWTAAAALTALCHAASEVVHSAGKHFAQPIQPAELGASNYQFVRGRCLKDRSISVDAKVAGAVQRIVEQAAGCSSHGASNVDALSVSAHDLRSRGVSVVYADPPYTAQQYSRFYHVLETVTSGVTAPIQNVRGSVPKGLYPAERYLSPFCSRRQASGAFKQLIGTARDAGAHLVLSYSTTGATSGNSRTIGEQQLVQLVTESYGSANVSVLDLDYNYRQFNRESRRSETSGTGEILIVGELR